MNIKTFYIFILTLLLAFAIGREEAWGQQEKLEILFSKEVRYDKIKNKEINIYWGDVQVKKGKTYMYMDSVRQIERDLWAYGDIIIQEGDSTTLFGDSMYFDDKKNKLFLYGDVVMQSTEEALFTNYLEYNLTTKVGDYIGGGTLTNKQTFLSSKVGTYFTRTEDMLFKDSVFVENPEFKLKADSLWFNQQTRIITFTGPTLIQFENSSIYCEGGYYNIPQKKALFVKNAQYSGEKSFATGDSILYLQDLGRIEISGDAYYREDSLQARAQKMIYFEKEERVQLIQKADFRSVDMSAVGDFLEYFTATKVFKTNKRTTIVQDEKAITANNFDVSNITGKGYISGNVFFSDTINKLAMWSDSAYVDRTNNYIRSFGSRPLLLNYAGGDSLWICADTLISFTGNPRKKILVSVTDSLLTMETEEDNLTLDSLMAAKNDTFPELDSIALDRKVESKDSTVAELSKTDTLTAIADRDTDDENPGRPDIVKPESERPISPPNMEFRPFIASSDTTIADFMDSSFVVFQGDTMGIIGRQDTLTLSEEAKPTPKDPRVILGIGDVRIYREGMQGVCDSLTYLELDSTFYLDGGPILWSDSTQISGDSIHLILVNNKIDRLLSINNAFIVTTIDGYFFSQIAGKRAEGFFEDNNMNEMLVRGAVRTVYYIVNEDEEYVGVNKQDASRLKILFEEGKAEDIYFYEKPEGEMLPMRGTDHESLKLDGFFFAIDRRPASVADLRPGLTDEVRDFITLGYLLKKTNEENETDIMDTDDAEEGQMEEKVEEGRGEEEEDSVLAPIENN